MATKAVKKRIDTRLGPADYTGPLNAAGRPHGLGVFEVVDGKYKGDTFEGHFSNGKREGLGKLSSNVGRMWQGQFNGGLLNGFVKVFVAQQRLDSFIADDIFRWRCLRRSL